MTAKKGKTKSIQLILPPALRWSSGFEGRFTSVHFQTVHTQATFRKRRGALAPKVHHVSTVSNLEETDKPTEHKRTRRWCSLAHSPISLSLVVTARPRCEKGFCCCDGSARELHWHCHHSERGEPSDSELTQHASNISWQRRSMAM